MAIPRNYSGALFADVPYVGALKWGTGINPIHAIRDSEGGRNIAPDGTSNLVPQALTQGAVTDEYGYTSENQQYAVAVQETGWETGTDDRPPLGDDFGTRADVTEGYPSYGYGPAGTANGNYIRSIEHGAIASNTPNQVPTETVSEGWLNKVTGPVIEPGSGISDPSQYTIQTSMQQLRRTRAGSQRGGGSASKFDAPITTRVPGQKIKVYSTGQRSYDMFPRQQEQSFRPFWSRTGGTGRVEEMLPNAWYQSQPLNREAPADPYQGPTVPATSDNSFGYTSEDGIY